MTELASFLTGFQNRCVQVVSEIAKDSVLKPYIDSSIPLPRPFIGSGPIKLVILGQDPTVDNKSTRQKINTVLMLNLNGALRRFVDKICISLGLNLQNVYATNVMKNFFTLRPNDIKEVDILSLASAFWLPLLLEELELLKNTTIICLGEPILKILVKPGYPKEMKHYWGYDSKWKSGKVRDFHLIEAAESTIGRKIFPVIHQPCRRQFYIKHFKAYMAFVRKHMVEGTS